MVYIQLIVDWKKKWTFSVSFESFGWFFTIRFENAFLMSGWVLVCRGWGLALICGGVKHNLRLRHCWSCWWWTDWLIGWFIVELVVEREEFGWLTDWLVGWLVDCLVMIEKRVEERLVLMEFNEEIILILFLFLNCKVKTHFWLFF